MGLVTSRAVVSRLEEVVSIGSEVKTATEGAIGITLCFSCVTPVTLLPFNFICEDELKLDKLPSITCSQVDGCQFKPLDHLPNIVDGVCPNYGPNEA